MSMSVPAILKYLNNNNDNDYNVLADMENNDSPGRSKKRRLDHLTWEEKIQRKKLKNRVAAQTSRDRKKAKMEQMESAIKELFDKNEHLISECEKLRLLNEKLQVENQDLHSRLRVPCPTCSHQSRPVECVVQNGSAASPNPRPKGLVRHSAAALNVQAARTLWKIVLACLLYQTCSTNSIATSISPHLKRSRRASFRISQQTWRLLLKRQIAKYVIRSRFIFKLMLLQRNSLNRPNNINRSVHINNNNNNTNDKSNATRHHIFPTSNPSSNNQHNINSDIVDSSCSTSFVCCLKVVDLSSRNSETMEPERTTKECPEQMVGPTSELVESDRCDSLSEESDQLQSEISQYLLLHHDYFAKRDNTKTILKSKRRSQPTKCNKSKDKLSTKMKFKEILPKVEEKVIVNVKPEIIVDHCESDLVYGTYDENTSCIVILNNDNLRLEEAVTEVTTTENVPGSPLSVNSLQTPSSDYSRDSLSPAPSSGYESIGSPSSEMDIWDECVSELFPSLVL
ncbi:x-box binding protein 1 [Holotrichia oblita]|uniref:X-box binding protein 1 n=1 Tax=Holotrichia oblita TaxID=644536 RepID=A0ACB9T5R2_HOLOL|nr:x-box binding protein 1 [Holotrichia oblita]